MDKITELKLKLAHENAGSNYRKNHNPVVWENRRISFSKGFDAAMELQFKFLDWAFNNNEYQWAGETWHQLTGFGDFNSFTHKELFNLWLENIYQPEK